MAAMANTLFVGNLPFNTSDDDIALAFAAYGCTSAKMQFHEDSGRSKGWALVQVSTDIGTVMEQMNDTDFQGRKLLVREDRGPVKKEARPARQDNTRSERPARNKRAPRDENEVVAESNTVFVGNLPWDVDSASLAMYFPGHLEANVQTRRDGRSAGYGLVTYETVELATDAIANTNGIEIGGRNCICRYDQGYTTTRAEEEVVAESNTVYVGKLPWDVDSAQLAMYFPGHIEANVQTRRDGSSAGYGLVTYETVELATDAITCNNGMDIGGRNIVCRFDRG